MTDQPDDAFQRAGDEINLAVRELVAERLTEILTPDVEPGMIVVAMLAGIVSAAGGLCAAFEPAINGDVFATIVAEQFNEGRKDFREQHGEEKPAVLPGLPGGDETGPRAPDESEQDKLFRSVESLRGALKILFKEPVEFLTMGTSAPVILAGTIYAQAMAAGIEPQDRHRRRAVKAMVMRNFDSGVEIGLRQASRVMRGEGALN